MQASKSLQTNDGTFGMEKSKFTSQNYIKHIQKFFGLGSLFSFFYNLISKNNGIVYVHGRDNRFRPIIVLQGFRIDIKQVRMKFLLINLKHSGKHRRNVGSYDLFSCLCY